MTNTRTKKSVTYTYTVKHLKKFIHHKETKVTHTA